MITNLKVKVKTMELLEQNVGENLCKLTVGKDFFDRIQKARDWKKIIPGYTKNSYNFIIIIVIITLNTQNIWTDSP